MMSIRNTLRLFTRFRTLPWLLLAAMLLLVACASPAAPPTPTATPIPPTPPPTAAPPPSPSPSATPALQSATRDPQFAPWSPLPAAGLPGPRVQDLAVAAAQVVLAVADGDVYRSSDGGATWQPSFSIYRGLQSVVASPAFATDQTAFAVDGGGRLFRTVDGGASWVEIARVDEIGGASDLEVWLAISPAFPADPTLWANTDWAAYRSGDGGLTWQPFDPGAEPGPGLRLRPNPDDPATPLLLPHVPDSAAWPGLPTPLCTAASGATTLLGTTRGLWRSDGGASWVASDAGLPRASLGLVAVAADGALYATVDGDERLYRLPAGGTAWEPLAALPAWPAALAASANAPSILALASYDGPFLSPDGGQSWLSLTGAGFPPAQFATPLPQPAGDWPTSGSVYLLHGDDLYHSAGGSQWSRVDSLPHVLALAATPAGGWLALALDGAYVQDPAQGPEWTHYPARFPDHPTTLHLSGEQALAVIGSDVYLSTDGRQNWTLVAEHLDRPVAAVSPRFDLDHALYGHDGAAVAVSTDWGRTWRVTSDGLPICEYPGSPECELVALLGGPPTANGYTLHALVRSDLHTQLWVTAVTWEE